jgi:hypothetical protein
LVHAIFPFPERGSGELHAPDRAGRVQAGVGYYPWSAPGNWEPDDEFNTLAATLNQLGFHPERRNR